MEVNLWLFLTISAVFGMIMICVIAIWTNKTKVKQLELETLKVQNANLKTEVDEAVARHIKNQNDRIEVLEAIVTDKKYDLNEKITNLR